MKLAQIFALAAFILFPVLPAPAGTHMLISGTVTDTSGTTLQSVSVRIESLYLKTDSQPNGSFNLFVPYEKITEGQSVRLTANLDGYYPQTRKVTLSAGDAVTYKFELTKIEDTTLTTTTTTTTP